MRLRVPQSRGGSFAEALANVVAGYGLALLVQRIAYPHLGIATTFATDSVIAAIFTVTSIIRSYLLRRLFEGLARHQHFSARDARA